MIRGRTWAFTLNNPVGPEYEGIADRLERAGAQFVFQEETGETGTIHYQGCCRFPNQRRFNMVKALISSRAHLEKARGRWKSNVRYCSKDDSRTGDRWTNLSEEFIASCHPEVPVPPRDPLEGVQLYPWQQEVMDLVEDAPDDRRIWWIYEEEGNAGKTTMAKHLCLTKPGAIYVGGKASDIKYAVQQMKVKPRLILWDIPRSMEQFVSYQGIEEVKNGIFFSGKYEGGMVLYDPPHVFVFANFPPDRYKLSLDRWGIRRIVAGALDDPDD